MKKRVMIITLTVAFSAILTVSATVNIRDHKYESINSNIDSVFLEQLADIEYGPELENAASEDTTVKVGFPLIDKREAADLERKSSIIEYFCAPLPSEFTSYKTSHQGLRDAISAVDTGGLSTSGKWHNGWDIACPDKTPVYATKSGYVAEVWPSYYNGPYSYKGHPAYGGLVIIKHSDHTITLYGHLSFTEVKEGQYVLAGEEIAWSGGVKGRRGSGTSTGPHLHYSVYLDMDSFMDY